MRHEFGHQTCVLERLEIELSTTLISGELESDWEKVHSKLYIPGVIGLVEWEWMVHCLFYSTLLECGHMDTRQKN